MATAAGLSTAYMARVENGQTECGIGLAEKIAVALEVPLRDLLPDGEVKTKKLAPEVARKRLEALIAQGDDQALAVAVLLLTMLAEVNSRRR